jgi:predicted nucleic acid-binding protein
VFSFRLISEYDRALHSEEIQAKTTESQRTAALSAIGALMQRMILVEPLYVNAVPEDEDDDRILGTALAGDCTYLATQDKHLLKLRAHARVTILRPEELLSLLNRSGSKP